MADSVRFQRLMEPAQIGPVRIRNRIVKSAATTGLHNESDGFMNERGIDFYEALARGGVGLIIVPQCIIDFPLNSSRWKGYRLDDDKYIPSFSELTRVIHKHNCPVFMHLLHDGPMQRSESSGLQPVSSSALARSEMPKPYYEESRELTVTEIEGLVEEFAKTAFRARKAGFDGIEINAAYSHLLNAFLSSAWNKRQDAYGGSVVNRARIVTAIIKEIKSLVGQDFPVVVLINGTEYALDKGITLEESQAFARIFQDAGSDAIQVRGEVYLRDRDEGVYGSVHFPELVLYPDYSKVPRENFDNNHHGRGGFVPLSAGIKKVVSVPVITVGRLDAELGEDIIRRAKADFISMNRRLVADPEYPNKIASGRFDDIAPCTACCYCFNTAISGQPMQCRINAALGKEHEYVIKPTEKKKRVLVVGGGPAGMEAARVAALRGHEVILYERENKLGGLLLMAGMVKGVEIEDLPALVRYLKTQVTKAGVDIRLGKKFTPSLIEEIKPDVLFLAAGGKYTVPDIPGIDKPIVVSSGDLNRKLSFFMRFFSPRFLRWLTKFWMPIGKRVLIMGGGIQGCELAEFLVKRGRKVSIVETAETLGDGMVEIVIKQSLLSWLKEMGAIMIAGVKYEEITDNGLTIITSEGKRRTIEADTIVTAMPLQPNIELLKDLSGKVPEIYPIGDFREPKLITDAIADGSCVARHI